MSADAKANYLNQSNENRVAYEKERHDFDVHRHAKNKADAELQQENEIQVVSAV